VTTINKIDGDARTVRALLGAKYAIDYYQREYAWERKDLVALLEDLETRFTANYDPDDSRGKVRDYGHYFLGPIVVSRKASRSFLIDGQQRLTTLTLLLIYLNHVQRNYEIKVLVEGLIYSESYGAKSFHLDVEERREAMQALFEGRSFTPAGSIGSVANLLARYADIEELFPDELQAPETLPYFLDWLLDNVELVEITTYNDEDAYAIFETMNDRGLRLTPAEMLKGYLLSKLDRDADRAQADAVWRREITSLKEWGAEEDANFFKAWLRAQYAQTIRERRVGATNQDFENIGSAFHKWVRDNAEARIGLRTSTEFGRFFQDQFRPFSERYQLIRAAEWDETPGLEYVYYNAANGFTLQPPLLLAPLIDGDDDAEIKRKFRLMAGYIDLYIFRRVINFKSLAYSTIQYTMFTVILDVRHKTAPELAEILKEKAVALDDEVPLDGILTFGLHQQNKNRVRSLLARLTERLEREAGRQLTFADYTDRERPDSFDIEHIWADTFDDHRDEFANEYEFEEHRNRLGGLLLLPLSFNRSYGALPYGEKRRHYNSQDLLARSLCDEAYERNPRFLDYIQRSGLPFRPYQEFKKADLDARQALYRDLAAQIWSLSRFEAELDAATPS
jgi:uncharacterized protein with ParB-like and HNH nuclease domain